MLVTPTATRTVYAADGPGVVGNWEGTLDPGAQQKKRIVVHITAAQDGTLGGTIDYPDQSASGILITAITYKAPTLHFESTPDLSAYDGTMNQDSSQLAGTWRQGSLSVSLGLKRVP
jgi:hypothetical protein